MPIPPCTNGWNLPPRFTGGLLVLFGGLKCLSAAQMWEALGQRPDPVLHLPGNVVMLAAGLMELGAAGVLLRRGGSLRCKARLMVGLALGWLFYQAGHAERTRGAFCPCLGQAALWFPGLAQFEREILTSLALWFCLVGLALLALDRWCRCVPEQS